MSPLGPISVFPTLNSTVIDPNSLLLLTNLVTKDQIFPRLHSNNLTHFSSNSSSSLVSGNIQNRRRTMTLKLNHSVHNHCHNNGPNNNNNRILHSIRNYIEDSEDIINKEKNDEDDEVLSIGGESCSGRVDPSEKDMVTTTTDMNPRDEETDGDIDVDDSMSTVTTTSPSPSSSQQSLRSPTPPDTSGSDPTNSSSYRIRNRNYSEDSLVTQYNPLSSLSEALIQSSYQQQQQRHHQASLFFSIANILRPDFGLGRLSVPFPGSITNSTTGSIGFHHSNSINSSSSSNNQRISSGKRPKLQNFHNNNIDGPSSSSSSSSNSKKSKHDPIIPIDLSRPSTNGEGSVIIEKSRGSGGHNGSTNNSSSNSNVKSVISSHQHRSSSSSSISCNNKTSSTNHHQPKKNDEKKDQDLNPIGQERSLDKSPGREKIKEKEDGETMWPAWVYCTRYSDRPSSGRSPRTRRGRKQKEKEVDEKRPRTAFTAEQLSRLKKEFEENRYLTEKRRQDLANDLRLHENQIKIWFQNKRAKLKKSTGQRGGLALQLMAQGLYNHSTIPPRGCGDEDDEDSD